MDIEELKKRLRAKKLMAVPQNVMVDCHEAADAIESLQRELSRKGVTIATISNALSFAERQSAERDSKAQMLENENRRLKLDLEEARRECGLLRGLVNTVTNIPNMSDEQLVQLRANCEAARNQKI